MTIPSIMEVISNGVRGAIIAPPGRKLVVADLSNIEGRVAAWLAGEDWKLQAFRDYDTIIPGEFDAKGKPKRKGVDLYVKAYMASFNVTDPTLVDKDKRQIGKVEELMFQYGGGVGAWLTGAATYGIDLDKMTEQVWDVLPDWAKDEAASFLQWLYEQKTGEVKKKAEKQGRVPTDAELEVACVEARYGLAERTFTACDAIKRLWRKAHPQISSYWKELEDMVKEALRNPGVTYTARKLKIRRSGTWLRIGLPSGRELCYPNARLSKDGTIVYAGHDAYSRNWSTIHTYGGKLFENCLARGTEVLTEHGWRPIEQVSASVRVWDGAEWVRHQGCVYSGKKTTITSYGVRMTADHKVLTVEGWKRASSCEGLDRAAVRLPDGFAVQRQQRQEVAVGVSLCVPQDDHDVGFGLPETRSEGRESFMRLPAVRDDQSQEHQARYVGASGLLGLAQHGRSLHAAVASRLGQLRRSWDHGLQALAGVIRELLGRHGCYVPAWAYVGAQEQQPGLQSIELRVGDSGEASSQHAQEPRGRYAQGAHDGDGSSANLGHQIHDLDVPAGQRLADESCVDDSAGLPQQAVFDLVNCGPRHRFVVRGTDGPLIVHNCVQAVACDQFYEPLPAIEDAGYAAVLGVHDEWVCETPDSPEYTADRLAEMMCAPLGWNEGLPLAAAGFECYRYRKGD